MKIENLGNGIVKITPDEGKKLIYALDKNEHSEAIVKEENAKYFREE